MAAAQDDFERATALKRFDRNTKLSLILIGLVFAVVGGVLGAMVPGGAIVPGTGLVIFGGVMIPATGIMLAIYFWREGRARKLATPSVVELQREAMDKSYRRFLSWGPAVLTYFALYSTLMIWRLETSLPASVTMQSWLQPEIVAICLALLGMLGMWFSYLTQFMGTSRRAPQDELVRANRAKGCAAGFVTASLCGMAMFLIMLIGPRIGVYFAPALLMLPLVVAMLRFGALERAACRE
jgi:hypothetical protein